MVRRTGVVGAGLMGADFAAMLANAGYDVTLVDIDETALAAARERHESGALEALETAGLRNDDLDDLVSRITYAEDLSALAGCEFVIEAVSEDLEVKRGVVASLEDVLDASAVVATNTSSLTPTDIGARMAHPERLVFFHFPNPPIERDVVEVGGYAADDVVETAVEVGEVMGKWVAVLEGEGRAHCLSRVSAAIKCAGTWELLVADPPAINAAAKGLGFPRGPIEFVDLIGVDVHLHTVENLHDAYDGRFDPPEEIRARMEEMVEDGRLGKKTGEGFFEWDGDSPVVPATDERYDVAPVVGAMVNEAHRVVADGITDRETLNEILKRGSGGEIGPFDTFDLLGETFLRETLEARYEETGASVYDPAF